MRARRGAGAESWRGRLPGLTMPGCAFVAALAWLAPHAAQAADAQGGARVLYFEPLPALAPAGPGMRKSGPDTRSLSFEAFGRQFSLSLEPNSRLVSLTDDTSEIPSTALPSATPGPSSKASRASASLTLYRGQLEDSPRSWVRLALKDDGARGSIAQGLIYDGSQLYVIEPAVELRDALTAPPASGSVIFRLADVLVDPGAASCSAGDASAPVKADQAYESLLQELEQSPAVAQAAGAARRLTVSALADAAFQARYTDPQLAREAVLIRLNNVDGIYSAQLGVEIRVDGVYVGDAHTDRLSQASSPNALLSELGKLRRRTPALRSTGLTHLFTGRDLEGTTIGIAYIDTLCSAEHGAGLTESLNAWRDSLVAAHEIGHNFGADHDGDPQGSCAATPSGFLMAPSVTGSDVFSECSLNRMRPRVYAAACITSLPPANVGVPRDLGTVHAPLAKAFDWQVEVLNEGGLIARDVRADLIVPPVVLIEDAYVTGGSCTSGAGTVQCRLGDLPGSASRAIHLRLRSEVAGANSISASVSSLEDATASNNHGDGTIVIASQAQEGPASEPPAQEPPNQAPTQSGGSGGGGGAFGAGWLLLLAALGTGRRLRRLRA